MHVILCLNLFNNSRMSFERRVVFRVNFLQKVRYIFPPDNAQELMYEILSILIVQALKNVVENFAKFPFISCITRGLTMMG